MSILSLTPSPSMEVSVHDKSFDAMIRDLLFTPLRLCSFVEDKKSYQTDKVYPFFLRQRIFMLNNQKQLHARLSQN